jgi:hypothetical protein
MGGSSAIVLLPLAIYFVRHPFDLYGRAIQVSVAAPEWSGGDSAGRLWRSIVETVRMFSVWGDPNYRFNVAGRPIFGPIIAVVFYGGCVLCLWRLANRRAPRRLASGVLLLWLVVMLLPMTLSAESLPYFQRAIGILPAVYILPAMFVDTTVSWTTARCLARWPSSRRTVRIVGAAMAGIAAVALTWTAGAGYFNDWHGATRNDDDRRVAMVYAAEYLHRTATRSDLYVSSEYPQHPALAFLAPAQYDQARWFDARQSLPLPPSGEQATYILLLENRPEPALLERVPDLRLSHTELDRFGRPVLQVYEWLQGTEPVPTDRTPAIWSHEVAFEAGDPQGLRHAVDLPANFGDDLAFMGHDRTAESAARGDVVGIVLYWRLLRKPARHYSMFVHLLDDQSKIVAEYDANRYPTSFWRDGGGETLLSYFPLWIDPATPSGEYRLEIGVYHQPTGERLPVYEGGKPVADRLLLRPVEVE